MFWQTFIPPQTFVLFGALPLSWYGICISLALLAGVSFLLWNIKRLSFVDSFFSSPSCDMLIISILIGGIIGARLFFVLYHISYFQNNVLEIPAVWNGGWVWHGGIIGGIGAAWIYWTLRKFSFGLFADLAAPSLVLAQSIGRWGNYFNQENYGLPTDKWFGILIEVPRRISGFEYANYFHPAFLYESLINLVIFFILLIFVKRNYASRDHIYHRGTIFFIYLILYSFSRFIIEFVRIDSVPIIFGLRAPQWISLFFMTISIIYFLKWRIRKSFLGIILVIFLVVPLPSKSVHAQTVFHSVPFISQAPTAKWSNSIFQNACEEASLLMAFGWVRNEKTPAKDEAEQKIRKVSHAMKKKYGTYYDSSAYDTAQFAKEYFHHQNIQVLYDITSADIQDELIRGKLVIVPVNGITIKNPNFKQPGPLQHMLVIKGYDSNTKEFITNDPGTRKGKNYRYPEKRFMNAIRDYPTGKHKPILVKRKAMIVIGKE